MATRAAAVAAIALATSYVIATQLRKKSRVKKLANAFQGKIRLPTSVKPSRYDLELTPKLETCKFDGQVTVTVNIVEETKYIVLNAADLTITDKSVWLRSKTTHQVLWPKSVDLHAEDELLVLSFDAALPLGEAILRMEFQGTLNDQMRGFYRSSYKVNGETRNMAVTQFEPADARRCFPCWDEPSFKATFKMTLHVPSDRVALSNMPIAEETQTNPKMKTIKFEESPRMSTYLVAIVVGELEYIEGHTKDAFECIQRLGKHIKESLPWMWLFVPFPFMPTTSERSTRFQNWIWSLSQILPQELWKTMDWLLTEKLLFCSMRRFRQLLTNKGLQWLSPMS